MDEETWIIIASNSYHQLQAFGPFTSEDEANEYMAKFEIKYPGLDWMVMEVDSEEHHALPNEHTPGYWRTVHGTYEKNSETGEVREKPCYETIHDFPG